MKKISLKVLCALGLLYFFTSSAFASDFQSANYIRQINAGSCLSWTLIRDSSGMSAYGCALYPTSYTALDGADTLRVINQLERRIADLEEKIRELSQK